MKDRFLNWLRLMLFNENCFIIINVPPGETRYIDMPPISGGETGGIVKVYIMENKE